MAYHTIPYHIISDQIIPYQTICSHIISYHIIPIKSYQTISNHIIPYHIIPYHITSYHVYHISNVEVSPSVGCLWRCRTMPSHDSTRVTWHGRGLQTSLTPWSYDFTGAERREWMGMHGNGIIIHNYYGSFPHSLLSTNIYCGNNVGKTGINHPSPSHHIFKGVNNAANNPRYNPFI